MGREDGNRYLNEQKLIWDKNGEMVSYGNSSPLPRIRLSVKNLAQGKYDSVIVCLLNHSLGLFGTNFCVGAT